MDYLIPITIGVGLAASCGFRVFLPLLVASGAALGGYLPLNESFTWLGTWPAFVAFAVASLFEIGAYYVPWLDNLLDTIASPLGVVAGALLFAASVTDLDPLLHWSLAIIAGGGAAGIVQGGTVVTRAVSTATTGGLANFVVSTLEAAAGMLFSVLAIVLPIVTIFLLVAVTAGMYAVGRPVLRRLFGR
jgi:hypothetical protein